MKAKKAVKRLATIKALISDLTKRYSTSAPHLREVLQYAEAAVTKAKEAVGLDMSSETKAKKADRAAKKATVQKKVAVKKVAVRARTADSGKKSSRARKAPKKRAVKNTAADPATQAAIG